MWNLNVSMNGIIFDTWLEKALAIFDWIPTESYFPVNKDLSKFKDWYNAFAKYVTLIIDYKNLHIDHFY